jgi:predicted DsbA family dithiol-disulfide isomerase/2-polyprenyl-6-methoxyphenol hydroxylase-like FAD-dependent oxidoreductase
MIDTKLNKTRVNLIYFSDPVCSTCWIVDSYVKKLLSEYASTIDLEVRMGGMLESWEIFAGATPERSAAYLEKLWDTESSRYGIQLDGSIWTKKPISSSTPASLAYYAAERQSPEKAIKFIRVVREMLFLQSKDISEHRHLVTAAYQVGLDVPTFLADMGSSKVYQKFVEAKHEKNQFNITHYPGLIFINEEGEIAKGIDLSDRVTPMDMYADWERILHELTNGNPRKLVKTRLVSEVLNDYARLSISEIVLLSGFREKLVRQELRSLLREGVIIREMHGNLEYYRNNRTPFKLKKDGFLFNNAAVLGTGVCGTYIKTVLEMSGIIPHSIDRQKKDSFRGLGFILLENGINALDAIGLKSELFKTGNSINLFRAISPANRVLAETELTDCIAISREDYFNLFTSRISEDYTHYGVEALEIDANQSHVKTIQLSNNQQIKSEIYFASDGVRSKLRKQVFPESDLEIMPEREIVGTAYLPELDTPQDVFLKVVDTANGKFMGMLPLGDGNYIWYLQINQELDPIESSDADALYAYVSQSILNYPAVFKQLIAATDFQKAFLWTAHRMDLLPAFNHKNLVFLGDAAHPLLAFTSQGANSALEDAAYLLTLLSHQEWEETTEEVFDHYYEIRRDAIQNHILEGDALLDDFMNLKTTKTFKLPLSIQ